MAETGRGTGMSARCRRFCEIVARRIGPYAGTLLVVTLVAGGVRGRWTFRRVVSAAEVLLARDGSPAAPGDREHRLWLYQDGTTWERGIVIPRSGHLDVRLNTAVKTFSITLQGNLRERYRVSVSSDGRLFDTVWTTPQHGRDPVLQTVESPWTARPKAVQWLRIAPVQGTDRFAVSWVSVERPPLVFHHFLLVPILWGGWLLLHLATRVPRMGPGARKALALWAAVDPYVAAGLVVTMLFEIPGAAFVALALLAAVFAVVQAIRRRPVSGTLVVVGTALVLGALLPRLLTRVVVAGIARFHELNVDHRMRPFVMEDINSDGIRFRGEAADLAEDDFVVLFLGDSFTYGFHLDYDDTYPVQFQRLASQRGCRRVVAVNMGWTSSSPLLSLRLLEEIGYEYKPDLVVYNLDMTDFSDDLRYEEALRKGGDLSPDPWAVVHKLIAITLPGLAVNLSDLETLGVHLRHPRDDAAGNRSVGSRFAGEKYFVTNHPLEQTRHDMARGVVKHLDAMHVFCRSVLHVPMVLVIYPRAFQYSLEESPENDEKGLYTPLGPYVLEPFRYFEQIRATLPYPVFSLLEPFRNASDFPLFFRDDPHWNAAGARVAAKAVVRALSAAAWIPCPERQPSD